jgi:hypothetical protein
VWLVDTTMAEFAKVVQVEEMRVPEQGLPLGVNGIKLREVWLYWTNTGRRIFARLRVGDDGMVVGNGEVEILRTELLGDDFCFDAEGRAWIAGNVENTVSVVKVGDETSGEKEVMIAVGKADEFTVAGGTACQFGRGKDDTHILYLVTTGGMASPVNGVVEGGKVVGIDTKTFDE